MGKTLGLILGIIVLLGLLGGGIYFYMAVGDTPTTDDMSDDGISGKVKAGAEFDVDMLNGEDVPGEPPASTYKNFETYTNEEEGVTIKYPSDWVVTPGLNPTVVTFTSPLRDTKDGYNESVSVIAQDISATEMSLEEFDIQASTALSNYMTNLDITEQTDAELDGEPAKVLQFTGTYPGEAELTETYQIYTVYDGYVYIITYKGAGDDFDALMPIVEKMILSFHF